MLDVLIKNANIIDGTGKPAYKGSIGISGGKLVMADGSEEATASSTPAASTSAPAG